MVSIRSGEGPTACSCLLVEESLPVCEQPLHVFTSAVSAFRKRNRLREESTIDQSSTVVSAVTQFVFRVPHTLALREPANHPWRRLLFGLSWTLRDLKAQRLRRAVHGERVHSLSLLQSFELLTYGKWNAPRKRIFTR